MTRIEAWCHHLANLLVGGTGILYACFLWLVEPEDAYAVVNHPWQPAVQHLHVLFAPLLVFSAGVVWRGHVLPRLRTAGRPRSPGSGIALLGTLLPMVASGYLLQTAVDPDWRQAWSLIHLATSLLWLAAWLVHVLRRRQRRCDLADAARVQP